MDYATFLAAVREAGGYADQQEAADTARIVLGVLGRRLGAALAHELAAQLPDEAAAMLLCTEKPGIPWDVREFIGHVALAMGINEQEAASDSTAVLSAVADTADHTELGRLLSRLPVGYADLFRRPEVW